LEYNKKRQIAKVAMRNSNVEIHTASGTVDLHVEVTENTNEIMNGLMYRHQLPWDSGMLFRFSNASTDGFWMKNTHIPLSIAFLDENNVIISKMNMNPEPMGTVAYTSYRPEAPYYAALEVNQGFFEQNDIQVGDTVNLITYTKTAASSPCGFCDDTGLVVEHANGPEGPHRLMSCHAGCGDGLSAFEGKKKEPPTDLGHNLLSPGNGKMGHVLNVSFPAGDPAKGGSCPMRTSGCEGCYVGGGKKKGYDVQYKDKNTGETLRERYTKNQELADTNPEGYVAQFNHELDRARNSRRWRNDPKKRLVRLMVSGDQTKEHFDLHARIAQENPDVRFWGTTRNGWLSEDADTQEAAKRLRDLPNVHLMASTDWGTELKQQHPEEGWDVIQMHHGETLDEEGNRLTGHGDTIAAAKKAKDRGQMPCPNIMGKIDKKNGKKVQCDRCQWCFTKGHETGLPVHGINSDTIEDSVPSED
jgi:uncharacterized membrane protein (UPF0127 family)